jgi:AcrR family transcriptional regulator
MAGRPREFDKDKALKQARDLFWERGYEGVSMSDLAETLGLASARLYAAFGSKEDIFRQAVELYEREEGGFADRVFSSGLPALEALEELFHQAIDLYTRRRQRRALGCMVVASATNCSSENDSIFRWLTEHRRKRTASIREFLRAAKARGELFRQADAEALGDLCAIMLHGLSVQARDGVPRERLLATIPPFLTNLKKSFE